MGSPQTTYSLNNIAGLPGQLYDNDESNFVDSKPCGAVTLSPGQCVDLVNGLLVPCQGTGNPAATNFWGVVLYKDSMEPGGYPPGVEVPVVRRGRIWALLDSGVTFGPQGAAVNYTHSSDSSHGFGTFTNAAVSATVGQEVSAVRAIWFKDGGLVGASPSIACIELSLP